ncbi:MAG: GrpB family protein [Paraclostridium sp.]
MSEVVVKDYNPRWSEEFKVLKSVYEEILKEYNVKVEHVGSTSVEGLSAKPILDIDIIAYDKEEIPKIIKEIEKVGYKHRGDLGIVGREAFFRESNESPVYNSNKYEFSHNLYVCQNGITALRNHILFRDYLRSDKEAMDEYGKLKRELAIKYTKDVDSYCEAKTDFITEILKKAGLGEAEINDIETQNTLD